MIVVTDLDGTLLDHHDYSWVAAIDAMALLDRRGIPLILNSSKTAAEMRSLRKALGNDCPYITENGSGICLPSDYGDEFVAMGLNRERVLYVLHALRKLHGFAFTGFADMDPAALIACTGLDHTAAVAALDRHFTEPLLWQDSEARFGEFVKILEDSGLACTRGGRFWHVAGAADKGRALEWLREHYGSGGHPVHVIALGDGNNDIPMLEAADMAVIIPSPVNPLPAVRNPRRLVATQAGPAGWNAALLSLLGPEYSPDKR